MPERDEHAWVDALMDTLPSDDLDGLLAGEPESDDPFPTDVAERMRAVIDRELEDLRRRRLRRRWAMATTAAAALFLMVVVWNSPKPDPDSARPKGDRRAWTLGGGTVHVTPAGARPVKVIFGSGHRGSIPRGGIRLSTTEPPPIIAYWWTDSGPVPLADGWAIPAVPVQPPPDARSLIVVASETPLDPTSTGASIRDGRLGLGVEPPDIALVAFDLQDPR